MIVPEAMLATLGVSVSRWWWQLSCLVWRGWWWQTFVKMVDDIIKHDICHKYHKQRLWKINKTVCKISYSEQFSSEISKIFGLLLVELERKVQTLQDKNSEVCSNFSGNWRLVGPSRSWFSHFGGKFSYLSLFFYEGHYNDYSGVGSRWQWWR